MMLTRLQTILASKQRSAASHDPRAPVAALPIAVSDARRRDKDAAGQPLHASLLGRVLTSES